MFPSSPPSVLVLVLLQGAPGVRPPTTVKCEDLKHIEMATTPSAALREICVSPGIMTGVLFDTPVDLELQDEARFVEVLRGRSAISFVPPRDMASGERLRLTARLGAGAAHEMVTLTLVAHSGQATHQVEVYRDRRPRESIQHEVTQERVKVQRLREQIAQMRTQLDESGELFDLVIREKVSTMGIQGQRFTAKDLVESTEIPKFRMGFSYRADRNIAAKIFLMNMGSENWLADGASLVDANGNELKGIQLQQEKPIPPNRDGAVIIEAKAARKEAQGHLTLTLRADGARSVTLTEVAFP